MRLENKVCVITGGAQGIGNSIAKRFSDEGAKKVYIFDMNEKEFEKIESEIKNSKCIKADVTDLESIKGIVDEIVKIDEKIDVLVNNAGVTKDALITKMTEKDWDFVIDVNLKGVFNMTKAIAPIMLENNYGSIINISSIVGELGNIGQVNYAATKGGVISMTKTLAKELPRKGANIRVNAVAPGFIITPMTETIPEKVIEGIKSKITLKRMGKPEEIANAVLFLACEESSYITGHVLSVNGGTSI